MRYTHVLFDHDGVLVDTEPLYYRANREVLADHGVALPLAGYMADRANGATVWQRLPGASAADIQRARARRNARYREMLLSEPIEIEGALEVLEALRPRHALAIVTTSRAEDFALIHRRGRIPRLVDHVLTRTAFRRSKPFPDAYRAALARFGIDGSRALAVEDAEWGLAAAAAAGIDCATVHNAFTAGQDFRLARYRVRTLGELAADVLAP